MRRLAVLLALAVLIPVAVAWARPADRDPAFSGDGIADFDDGSHNRFRDIALLPGGDVAAVGRSVFLGGFPRPPAVALRYDGNGNPRGPVLRLDSGADASAAGVAIDSQGRLLVALDDGHGRVTITRLVGQTPVVDTTYGREGVSANGTVDADAADVIGLGVTPDDRPVVVANHAEGGEFRTTLLRWNTDGVLDSTFGTAGRIELGPFVVAHDMLVDTAGRIVIARSVGGRGFDVLRIGTATPGTVFEVPDAVETLGMQVALAGTDILVAGATGSEVRLARLNDAGAVDTGFGTPTAPLPGHTTSRPSDLVALPGGKVVVSAEVEAGAQRRLGLVRFNADGTPDATFKAGGGGHFAVDDLDGASRDAHPQAGLLAAAGDKLLVGGRTGLPGDDGGEDRGFVARYGVEGLPPEVSLSRSYRAIGDPPTVRGYARPGQTVDFAATASDPDGPVASYAWDPDGDGVFTDEAASASFGASYPTAGTYQAGVRVRDADGLTATASATVDVVLNERPSVVVRRGYDADPSGSPSTFSADRPVVFKAIATDPDGNVKRIQFDLDGQLGFEVDGATATRTFPTPGAAIVNVRATDDEGTVTDERIELTITEPPCSGVKQVAVGRLRANAAGWQRVVTKEGQPDETVTWTACVPAPPQFLSLTSQLVAADQFDLPSLADRPSVNGIYFITPEPLQVVQKKGAAPRVVWASAQVEVPAPDGTRFRLIDGLSTGSWKLEDNRLKNVATRGAVYGGLKVGALAGDGSIPLPAAGQAKISFYPQLPPVFGGVSADQPVEWTTNAPQQRQFPGGNCFTANGANLPGLDFLPGGQGVRVCRRTDDPDAFDFNVKLDLASFGLPAFDGLPTLDAAGGINDGELTGISAEATFGGPGVSLVGPIFLRSVDFQLVLDESSLVDLGCVNGVGVKTVSLAEVRQIFIAEGFPADKVNQTFPDIVVDYGTPSSALCGGAGFYAGFDPVELASGNISLGVAEYDDGRPDAFRILGRADILEVARGEAELSIYSSGYVDMRTRLNATFFDFVSLEGRVLLQVDAPTARFNAEASVTGCVVPIDTCAGIRALISSRGIGACLLLSFFGADWEPGATYNYREGLTPYFSGCDLGDVRVHFNAGESSTIITYAQPDGRAAWTGPGVPAPARIAQNFKHEQTITVKPGLPGTYIAVRGQNNQLAKFTLTGPKGERISADGPSDSNTPTKGRNLIVGNDEKLGITHVLIGTPTPGKWTLTPDAGSVPIVEVVGADGIDKPKIHARVSGNGHRRVLRYSISPRKGQVVTFREDGPTGKQLLGRARGRRGKLHFDTAAGNAERRTIVAVVEQDGLPREELEVARFRAPATQRAGRIARTRVRRRGTKVTLRWLPSSGATSYRVRARLSDGRVILRETRRRRLILKGVAKRTTGSFRVAGINAVGEPGRPKPAKLKRAKKRKRG